MAFVIRHNTQTGLLGLYATAEEAGKEMPVFASEKEFAKTSASISELLRFYNHITKGALKAFRDKPAAVKRVWAAATEKMGEAPAATAPATEKAPPATKAPAKEKAAPKTKPEGEKSKRGRKAGTGEFAGKMIFPLKDVNPRRIGTGGFNSFEIIRGKKSGVTYADYVAQGGRPQDLRWDIERKWAEVK